MLSKTTNLLPAQRSDEPALADMLHLYAREFSAFHPVEFGADGRFVYRDLPNYWADPGKHAFLIKSDVKTAGFALVQQASSVTGGDLVWEIAEFFVLRKFRRRGVGMEAAHRIWRRLPGLWQVRVLEANHAAVHFWHQAVLRFTDTATHPASLDRDGDRWRVYIFESAPTG